MSRKRGQGEGSIYKRRDGSWSAQVSIQGKRVSKYFKTQREGLDWLQQMRNQIQVGLTVSGTRMSLSELLDQWLISHQSSVRPKTIRQYGQIAQQHIIPHIGNIKLKELRRDHVQQLYNSKLSSGTSPRTVRLIHAVLRQALNLALDWGLIGQDPTYRTKPGRKVQKEMMTLTDSQARAFLSAAEQTRYDAFFYMAIHTGMRQGELLGLRWSDLNWSAQRVHVNRQLQHLRGEQLVFNEPKTAAGRRVIALSKTAINKLRTHQEKQSRERGQAGERWQENDLIFPTKLGTPMYAANMYKVFKTLLKDLNLPNIRFHDLRHTAATLMLQQGIHPKIVQERLGHSDVSLTLNTYSHVLPSMQEDAADKMDELLTPIEVTDEINRVKEITANYRPNTL